MDKKLDKISSPSCLNNFSNEDLYELSEEIREFLIEKVSKTGGHLASNLGVVELTLSLYKVFNMEEDKIVWDVGHQSYIHKILTGRKDSFDTLRKYNGLCGFPKITESKYDAFGAGHSSTSISAAIGIARARDIKKENYDVVAVIGDGALTGGMALEALNDVGFNKTNLTIILNDNQMSISENVGGLSNHLNKLRIGPGYNKLKQNINSTLGVSNAGKIIKKSIHKIKDSIKQLIMPSMFFEGMGIKYIGPIDGHDIEMMNEVLSKAKAIEGPVLIHVITQKGKGYQFAEKNPNKFHGVSPFNLENGEVPPKGGANKSYSKVFGDTMIEIAKENEDLVAITAAMPDGTGLKEFSNLYKERLFDVGIAEEHATTLAAGMARAGLKPVFAVYSTFLQRAYDQIIHDVCIQKLPVIFAIDRAGIVGEDGETHQGVFDLSYLIQIPNMTILAPKQLDELALMLKWAINENMPIALRYPRGGDIIENITPIRNIKVGKWEKITSGKKVAIIAVGKMVQHALVANEELQKEGIETTIISATFVKPLDTELLKEIIEEELNIITIEDNVINGGFGSYVLMELNKLGFNKKYKSLGFKDDFIQHGDVKSLYKDAGLDFDSIRDVIIDMQR